MSITQELPRAGAVDRAAPLSLRQGRGRGRVGVSHFTAQSVGPGHGRALSYLPDEVDVKPRRVVEFVALQEKGEGVGAGCTGVTELGPAHGGELLLHLQRRKSGGGGDAAAQRSAWCTHAAGKSPTVQLGAKTRECLGSESEEDPGGCRLLSRLPPCPETFALPPGPSSCRLRSRGWAGDEPSGCPAPRRSADWHLLGRISPPPSCCCKIARWWH